MLTPEEFRIWCQRLQLPPETEAVISAIRNAQPGRKVQGRVGNVAGRYPSPKMGRSIQFESRHVELWAIYGMERDDDVLEYYEQPAKIPLSYRAKSGRSTTQWHTADFFVLRQGSAGWEECKSGSSLDDLARTMPGRYQQTPAGPWRCPPGETYATHLGLTYRVRSSAEYHPLYIQNLKFLQDFWAQPVTLPPAHAALVLPQVKERPGLLLAEVLDACPDLEVDVVWALLATRQLFTDLSATSLMRHNQVQLFPTDIVAAGPLQAPVVAPPPQAPSPPLVWDGRLWLVESVGETVTLRPEFGQPLLLSTARFQHLLQEGAIRIVTAADPSPTTPEIRDAFMRASPKSQEAANHRLQEILAYERGEPITASARSVQRWLAAYDAAAAQFGCGYVGLLPRVADRGNRTPRVPEASLQLLKEAFSTHYATPQAKGAAAVYALYRADCSRAGVPPVSERTFYRRRSWLSTPAVTAIRKGRRAAYAERPFFWLLDQTTPRHGERPWALAHIDHTELDIELVSSVSGEPLGRPWATLLLDAYSRRVLAVYLTYDPPSYRSVMLVLRLCVLRYGRLPQELVVDGGAEFGSVYFETLLSRYFITKLERPAGEPRAGAVIERLFGTAHTEFIDQLLGNTQASKTPRQRTRAVDPKRLAVWTLERFSTRLTEWADTVYDRRDHPALGLSPHNAYDQGTQLAGARTHRLIPYSEEFLMLTRPTTRTGRAKVDGVRGITVNWLHYWHPIMQSPGVAGSVVPVRYEPFDMGVVFAFIGGQWLDCFADQYAEVHGRSEREWLLILEEWRAQQRQQGKQRVVFKETLLAPLLESVAAEEQLLAQQQRDLEGQALRAPLLGFRVALPVAPSKPAGAEDEEVDLTAIPRYEEYRT